MTGGQCQLHGIAGGRRDRLGILLVLFGIFMRPALALADTPGDRSVGIIIGAQDTRHPSANAAVGRILVSLDPRRGHVSICTGWLTSFGAILTAGHCYGESTTSSIQFNVPSSTTSGGIRPPVAGDDTYSLGTPVFANNGKGQDWAVVPAFATNGLTPAFRQKSFIRLSGLDQPAGTILVRVTGYGADETIKARNSTQQTATGAYLGASGKLSSAVCYLADTMPGSSGGPVLLNGAMIAIAIHTAGDSKTSAQRACDVRANTGTILSQPQLLQALADAPGLPYHIPAARTVFVDGGTLSAHGDGTVLAPFAAISQAFAKASNLAADSLITVVAGGYAISPATVQPQHNMTVTMPVGDVTLYMR
jgi:V8-like Glu-specific endopeptidase